jgi:hypothetical protein
MHLNFNKRKKKKTLYEGKSKKKILYQFIDIHQVMQHILDPFGPSLIRGRF